MRIKIVQQSMNSLAERIVSLECTWILKNSQADLTLSSNVHKCKP